MIIACYQIGTIINQRKEWGNKYIKKLAVDLKEYGKGYSYDQLYRMSQLASIFAENEIMGQVVPQIPWGTIVKIMKKSSSKEEILWYVAKTAFCKVTVKIGVSKYKILEEVPDYLADKLNDINEI